MDYTEADLPVTLKETEALTLEDGTTIRFEENGGARDIMLNDEWSPATTLFPACDYFVEAGGKRYRLLAGNDDLLVERA